MVIFAKREFNHHHSAPMFNIDYDYYAFKNTFRLRQSNYVNQYFYNIAGRTSERDQIIQNYNKKHKRQVQTPDLIIKILSQEARKRLKTLPIELRTIAKNLVHKRANGRYIGNQAFRTLYEMSSRLFALLRDNQPTIVQYYVIATDVVELKHYAKEVSQRLKSRKPFLPDYPDSRILQWHTYLIPIVQNIRFRNEWYAIYYIMRPNFRKRSMKDFATMMNLWFPKANTPCTYDAISDYHYLNYIPTTAWLNTPVTTKTQATLVGVERIQNFISANHMRPQKFPDTHYLL